MHNLEQLHTTIRANSYTTPDTLKEGWVYMADKYKPWYWYLSLTFQYFVEQEYALRQFGRFIRLMNEKVHGKRYRGNGKRESVCKGIPWLNAIEYQRRGVLHFHALLGGESYKLNGRGGYPDMSLYTKIWQYGIKKKNGEYKFYPNGFAIIVQYDARKDGAKHYLAKYTSKGGQLDIHVPKFMYPYYGINGEGGNSFEFLNSNV